MSIYEISALRIIAAIKARPALYNRDDPRYHVQKQHKDKIWRAVCKEVCKDWDQLTSTQKLEFVHVLQKRWRNLRTCFSREVTLQKRERKKKSNETNENSEPWFSRKRKKYEHFDAMKFLLDPSHVDNVNLVEDSNEILEGSYELVEGGPDDPLDSDMKNETSPATSEIFKYAEDENQPCDETEEPYQSTAIETTQYENRSSNRTIEERLLDLLAVKKGEEKDEDRQFLLSLVSSMKKLKYKQKLQAKIEILNVFRRIHEDESC